MRSDVCGLGKFEGEAKHVQYYWEMDDEDEQVGESDTTGCYRCWTVTADDVARFPHLQVGDKIVLVENSQGFVSAVDEMPSYCPDCGGSGEDPCEGDENATPYPVECETCMGFGLL